VLQASRWPLIPRRAPTFALGLPLLDGDARAGRPTRAAARWAACGFPLVVVAVLVFAVLLVMVPMERPAG
jgi:hypothetical protein